MSQLEVQSLCPKKLTAIQAERLAETLKLCKKIPFYIKHVRWNDKQINFHNLPILLPENLRLGWTEFQTSETNLVSIYASGGTLGSPKFVTYTKEDWEEAIQITARSLITLGIRNVDRVAIIQPFGLWAIGANFLEAVRSIGGTALPWGIHLSDEDVASLLFSLKPTIIMASPGNLCRLTEKLEALNILQLKLKQLNVRAIILSGELLTSTKRNYLAEVWGTRVFSLYGSAETDSIACECSSESTHHVWADQFFIEIEGKGVITPGQKALTGNLIITTLTRRAMPLLRYRLGDKVCADWLPCTCGVTHPRIRIIGRCDNSITLADGTILQMNQIEEIIKMLSIPVLAVQGLIRYAEGKEQLVVRLVPNGILSERKISKITTSINRLSIDFADALEAGILLPSVVETISLDDLYRSSRGKILPFMDCRNS